MMKYAVLLLALIPTALLAQTSDEALEAANNACVVNRKFVNGDVVFPPGFENCPAIFAAAGAMHSADAATTQDAKQKQSRDRDKAAVDAAFKKLK